MVDVTMKSVSVAAEGQNENEMMNSVAAEGTVDESNEIGGAG